MRKNDQTWFGLLALMAVLSAIPFVSGVMRWRESARNGTQQTFTYAEAARARPSQGWVRITGCRIDLSRAVENLQNNTAVRVYAPVFDVRNPQQSAAPLFAEMDDQPTLRLMLEREEMARSHSPQEIQAWTAAHRAEFQRVGDLTGLARRGLWRPTEDLDSAFHSVASAPVAETVFVAAGWEPNLALARWHTVLGGAVFLLCAAGLWRLFHKR